MVYRYTKAPSQRQLQVSEEIRHAISESFIRNEMSHPFFDKNIITVNQVRISQDLKSATVFLALPNDIDQEALVKTLNEGESFFRKVISSKVKLKYAPRVRFVIDEAVKTGTEVDAILRNI